MDLASGLLEKMEIIAYSDESFSAEIGRLKVPFNPGGYKREKKHNYIETPVIGGKDVSRFANESNEKQSFEFLFDATLTSAMTIPVSVQTKIDTLIKLAYNVNGDIHKPNQLLLSWGSLQFKCFCQSIDIDYTHFNVSGIPIRAKVKADFSEKITHKENAKKTQKASPDMTHQKVISAGVSLTSITHKIYRDPSYYIELAAFNGLDTFRGLKQGTEIIVPPLKTANYE